MTNMYHLIISYYNYMLYMMFLFFILLFLLNMKNHPISIMIIILAYSSLICINMSLWKMNYILSIFLFLMMISGLLIIFLYFASLISNEQFKINLSFFYLMLTSYLINMILTLYLSKNMFMNLFIYKYKSHENITIFQSNKFTFYNILNLYEYPLNNLTILSMFYLLLSLFIIIKICSSKSMSLRKIK